MKTSLHFLAVVACLMAFSPVFAAPNPPSIIPVPKTMELKDGAFKLDAKTIIFADSSAKEEAQWLAKALQRSTAYPIKVKSSAWLRNPKGITLTTKNANPALGQEGYELDVTPDKVLIRAPHTAGLFYGAQTFLQLFQPEIFATNSVAAASWEVPAVHIEDQPRFQWRGLMLDVSRHFYTKEEVKRFLDIMAVQKLNTFHWHLVDDQGWRIDIKKYPLLTKVGAWRKGIDFNLDPKSSTAYGPDGRYGGFYTQEDIREVVAYAKSLHITIVPEIEMPGHCTAALSAYPELGCFPNQGDADIGAGIHPAAYCAANEQSYVFLQNVLSEVFDLFPSRYIHIGGDEVIKDNWKKCPKCQALMKNENLQNEHEVQSYFVKRMESFITSKNRTLLGWSEIREGGLAASAAIMDWMGGGFEAASEGHDVVMAPTTHCYLDYYQSTNRAAEPRSIGGYIPLSKVYSFEPIPQKLDSQHHKHILGIQGNLWTEYIASFNHVTYMIYPRACAIAEIGWSPLTTRNYENFVQRLQVHEKRLDQAGINHRPVNKP